jgi:phosphoribosylanthranilate isomerase
LKPDPGAIMSAISVKICGVRSYDAALAAARAGADLLGFVFFRKSPRFLAADAAEDLIVALKQASFEEGFLLPQRVGLFVDAGEQELSEAAPFLTHFQFHGHETPEHCARAGREFAVEIIKAAPVGAKADLAPACEYADAADYILFDAKPPPTAARPGGHGKTFDWSILAAYEGEAPYFVAGGLTAGNVAQAVAAQSGSARFFGVDVSSGVEKEPGVKDNALIADFVSAAKSAAIAQG